MTTHRPIILRELPADKTTDEAELARAEPYRHYAEWETPEGICDEPDPLWSAVGFGATGQDAYIDLIAKTTHDRRGQTDEQLHALLAGHVLILEEAAQRAEHYAACAFNTATGQDGADAELLIELGQTWTQTAATLRRLPKLESTRPPPQILTTQHAADAAPETVRALGELLLVMPPEVKRSQTFGITFRGSDGQYVIAVVATRDPKRIAEFVQTGLIAPASDTPMSDCPQHIADQLTDEVTFTAPDGEVFTGSPADVGVEVAEALIEYEGETWSLPSVLRDHTSEHLVRVLDATEWSPSARRAAYHLYRITTAAPDALTLDPAPTQENPDAAR